MDEDGGGGFLGRGKILTLSTREGKLAAWRVLIRVARKHGMGGGGKSWVPMQETWVRSLDQEVPLEKEMATHSSILAWEVP